MRREGRAAAVLEGEAGQQDPVEEAFEQGWNTAPPDREDEHQMLGPTDQLLGVQQVGFQGLYLLIAVMQDRVEGQVAKLQQADVMALLAGAGDVAVA
ncbi:hypothetical protein D3C72_2101590 [compost metagenome]